MYRLLLTLAVLLACACAVAQPPAAPRTVTFRPLDPVEPRYVYRDSGSQEIPAERTRFHDGTAYIVYRFAFEPNTPASLRMTVTAQFQVDLSSDGKRFDTVATHTQTGGEPLILDLTPYNRAGLVYVRVGDARPDDGWGGKVHEVSVTGRIRDIPIVSYKPTFLRQRTNLYARLAPPRRRLYVFEPASPSMQEVILFRTLQGLVNRERNELIVLDSWKMADELRALGWADDVERIPDAAALFGRYPRRDVVVYDPALYGSENIAVMVGAMDGWAVAHPNLVAKYGLRVREDLRGRWTTTLDAYRAIYARYKGRFNRRTLVMCAPSKRPGLYDYAVAHRAFTFWIAGGTDAGRPGADRWAEEEWFEETLSRDFPVNIPILGYPQVEPSDGIGEDRGVALFSRCAKFLVPADHMSNMSLLTAYPSARGSIHVPTARAPALDRSKVYASLVLSDGDNLCLWNGPTAFMFEYMRRMKEAGPRDFSVSYTLGPSIVDLNPAAATLVDRYVEPQDSIGCAVSGVGYMYMRHYGNNFGADRERVVREFTGLTARYMGYAGERWAWIMDYGGPGSARLRDYAALRNCVALMGGYGQETTDPARTAEPVGPAVAFHSVSRAVSPDDVYRDVVRVTSTGVRPLFLHVFISNWSVDPPRMRELAARLGRDGVQIVTPETLANLYRQAHRE